MKKCICVAALCCGSALAAHAQTSAGTVLLGGSLNFSSNESESTSVDFKSSSKSHGYGIAPRAGYFLTSNLAIGLEARYSHSTSTEERTDYNYGAGSYNSTGHSYEIGPFVRYYQMIGEKAGFFGQVQAIYQHSNSDGKSTGPRPYSIYTQEDKGRGYSANFSPGFVYFPTPKLGLELTLGYIGYGQSKTESISTLLDESTQNVTRKSSGFAGNVSLSSLTVGAAFYLGH